MLDALRNLLVSSALLDKVRCRCHFMPKKRTMPTTVFPPKRKKVTLHCLKIHKEQPGKGGGATYQCLELELP
jgi:hypothetical protein